MAVEKQHRTFRRRNMISSPSSSTSSAYTSADDARKPSDADRRNFLASDDAATARLLRSYSPRRRPSGFLSRLRSDKSYPRTKHVILGSVLVAVILAGIILVTSFYGRQTPGYVEEDELIPLDPETVQPPSWSELRTFRRGAACADGAPCAVIGKLILEKNGSAVDAALAAMICNGLVNMQSMGIGGGFVMTVYDRATRRAYTLNARDQAPLAANTTMYNGRTEASFLGPLAIAVPGELAGYWEAHKRFGKLPWSELFEPTIELCEGGYNLTKIQHDGFKYNEKNIYNDPTLKSLFVDPETNDFYKPGSTIRPKELCRTLRIIAEKNATVFYNGTLGEILVEDLREKGAIITTEDLRQYRAIWAAPLQTNISNGITVYTIGLPASGGLLTYILNILDDFHFTPESLADHNATILTYHQMIETFKFAYALRTELGDTDSAEMVELHKNLTSKSYAHSTRLKINNARTWENPRHYGAKASGATDNHGTAHISILAPNGDAVSATSTINFYFGSGVVSQRTGILLNNAMNDFGIPSTINYFGIPPSRNNYIAPGKRPLSSMVPSILVDSDGAVKMVAGASGGTKITTTVSQVIAKILWMGKTVKEAVDAARIHHQLFPGQISYEYGVPKQVIDGLKRLGHKTARYRIRGSVACLILVENNTIFANADYRKGGDVYGLD